MMRRLSFRQKVLLLAVALVTAIQLVTLVPVLRAIQQDAEAQARRSVNLAGLVFDEFMADEMGTAERVYAVAGEPLTDDASSAITRYLEGHRRGRHGRVHTSPEMFGLDPDDLRKRFAPYLSRFLMTTE